MVQIWKIAGWGLAVVAGVIIEQILTSDKIGSLEASMGEWECKKISDEEISDIYQKNYYVLAYAKLTDLPDDVRNWIKGEFVNPPNRMEFAVFLTKKGVVTAPYVKIQSGKKTKKFKFGVDGIPKGITILENHLKGFIDKKDQNWRTKKKKLYRYPLVSGNLIEKSYIFVTMGSKSFQYWVDREFVKVIDEEKSGNGQQGERRKIVFNKSVSGKIGHFILWSLIKDSLKNKRG